MKSDLRKIISLLEKIEENTRPKKTTKTRGDKEKAIAKELKELFKASYSSAYQCEPTWAAKENKLVYDLLGRVGEDEAKKLVWAYPKYPDPFHVRQKHPFALLVAQLDKVRVELNDPRRMFDATRLQKQVGEAQEKHDRDLERARLEAAIERENQDRIGMEE